MKKIFGLTSRVGIILPLIVSLPAVVRAGSEVKQYWLDVNPQWLHKSSIKVKGNFGVRASATGTKWIRYLARPSIIYGFGNGIYLSGGIGFLYTDYKESPSQKKTDLWELRPFQGLGYLYRPSFRVSFDFGAKLEERYFYEIDSSDRSEALRVRFGVTGAYKFDAYQDGRYWKVTLGGEVFDTVSGSDVGEKSRVNLGFERSFSHAQRLRLELTWQKQGRLRDNAEENQLFIRLRYYPSWGNVRFNPLRDL